MSTKKKTDRQILESVDCKLDLLSGELRHARRDAAVVGGVAGALSSAIVSTSILLLKHKMGW